MSIENPHNSSDSLGGKNIDKFVFVMMNFPLSKSAQHICIERVHSGCNFVWPIFAEA